MGEASATLTEPAPAKINLALHVRRRRPDGYHDLDSLAAFADVGDRLSLVGDDGPALTIDGPFADALGAGMPDEANLVLKAAAAVAKLTGEPATARMHLTKNLPVAAGLGGGSADAAAALRLLGRRRGIGEDVLAAIAPSLGADVPMCLRSAPLRARGVGEAIEAFPGMPRLPIVLVFPGVPVRTAAIFRRLAEPADPPLPPWPEGTVSVADVAAWLGQTTNGLQDAAIDEAPVIGDALAALRTASACLFARMTGSGSTCFGLFPSREAAAMAASAIGAAHPDWWVRATMTGGSG